MCGKEYEEFTAQQRLIMLWSTVFVMQFFCESTSTGIEALSQLSLYLTPLLSLLRCVAHWQNGVGARIAHWFLSCMDRQTGLNGRNTLVSLGYCCQWASSWKLHSKLEVRTHDLQVFINNLVGLSSWMPRQKNGFGIFQPQLIDTSHISYAVTDRRNNANGTL